MSHPRWFSRCLGCHATLFAISARPGAFEGVRCLIGCQPLSARVVLEQGRAEKELYWVEGTSRRWDGYTFFQHNPERILGWLATYLGQSIRVA